VAPGFAGGPAPGSAGAGRPTRADIVFGLVQQLADAAAEAENRPRRALPRLDADSALADQLRVTVVDLLAADASDEVLRSAAASIQGTARAL
jgi:hypothetical protein